MVCSAGYQKKKSQMECRASVAVFFSFFLLVHEALATVLTVQGDLGSLNLSLGFVLCTQGDPGNVRL